MKSLNQYILNESLIIEDLYNVSTIDDVYDYILEQLLIVNEGIFSKIGSKLKEWGNKAAESGESLDKKISELSNSAKDIINKAKQKAGKVWGNIKDAYISIVYEIDKALSKIANSYENICKNAGVKYEEMQAKMAALISSAIASGNETGKTIQQYISDKTQGAQKLVAISTLLLGAQMSVKAGVDSSVALDMLSMAGFK